ncbi:MAG TPA: hypothetical protein VGB59_00155 [Allosphingosinicella sp.]|jgi:hypothetical protein
MKFSEAFSVLLLGACVTADAPAGPQDAFWQRLSALCGKAFEGRVASPPVEADRDFAGKRLVMHVRSCTPTEIRIPFQVGDDRSRTWVVTLTSTGLRLKHDHRHEDGSEDVLTQYGGDTVAPGTAARQEFHADAFSKRLFVREGRDVSVTNVWAMEVHPRRTFAYELRRPGRFFRVDFDLSRPAAPPPPPWGAP